MRRRLVVAAVAIFGLVPFADVLAQEQPPPLRPGSRVQVTAPSLGIDNEAATFEAWYGDTLAMAQIPTS